MMEHSFNETQQIGNNSTEGVHICTHKHLQSAQNLKCVQIKNETC